MARHRLDINEMKWFLARIAQVNTWALGDVDFYDGSKLLQLDPKVLEAWVTNSLSTSLFAAGLPDGFPANKFPDGFYGPIGPDTLKDPDILAADWTPYDPVASGVTTDYLHEDDESKTGPLFCPTCRREISRYELFQRPLP